MKLLPLAALFALLPLAAPAADKPATPRLAFELAPGKVHEECLRLEAGEKRRYHWKSDAPVDFNIHYHKGPEIFYPVKRDRMRGDGGTFTAKTSEDYCWMWTAKDKAAKVTGEIER